MKELGFSDVRIVSHERIGANDEILFVLDGQLKGGRNLT